MHAIKLLRYSALLKRDFHADLFLPDDPVNQPTGIVVFFGGSGITKHEYQARMQYTNPAFETILPNLVDCAPFALLFVTAPYDLSYTHFDEEPECLALWQRHVAEELLVDFTHLPTFFIGYSGGILLALAAMPIVKHVAGIGGLGADAIPDDLQLPQNLRLRLYYNSSDPIFKLNQDNITTLVEAEQADCFNRLPGSHTFCDYSVNRSIEGMLRFAVNNF